MQEPYRTWGKGSKVIIKNVDSCKCPQVEVMTIHSNVLSSTFDFISQLIRYLRRQKPCRFNANKKARYLFHPLYLVKHKKHPWGKVPYYVLQDSAETHIFPVTVSGYPLWLCVQVNHTSDKGKQHQADTICSSWSRKVKDEMELHGAILEYKVNMNTLHMHTLSSVKYVRITT